MIARKQAVVTEAVPILAVDDDYWSKQFRSRPYATKKTTYETYRPAYEHGTTMSTKYAGKSFEEVEADMRAEWERLHAHGKAASRTGRRTTTEVEAAAAPVLTWEEARPAVRDAWDRSIQLREEELHVDKESVETGEVQVRKEVKTEVKNIEVPVEREEVVIERRSARGKAARGKVGEPEEIRIPVREERVKVTKTPVVKEEVSVSKRKVRDTKKVTDTVRSEEAVVEEKGKAKVAGGAATRRGKK